MPHDLPLVTTIAAALASAWVLGVLAQRIGLSPIVGNSPRMVSAWPGKVQT